MQWPSSIYNTGNQRVNPVMVNIIKALAPHIRANLLVQNTAEIKTVKDLLKTAGFNEANLHYYIVNHLSIWARDVGPIFVRDGHNGLKVVNFGFNNYSRDGDPEYIRIEGRVDQTVAGLLKLSIINTNLISEGGAIESNGLGTLMVPEAVAFKRNPGMSKRRIAKEYQRALGVKKIIWLQKGLAEDDRITSGHINEFARFADPNTILLARVLPEERYINRYSQESYRRMEENYRILKNSSDQDGKPFRIIRIPMPPTLYQEADITGELPVRSYLNYAATNGVVLMQNYWKPGRPPRLKVVEDQVRGIFRRVFPGRAIIGIDAENVNRWGGGIHCITQHMPAE